MKRGDAPPSDALCLWVRRWRRAAGGDLLPEALDELVELDLAGVLVGPHGDGTVLLLLLADDELVGDLRQTGRADLGLDALGAEVFLDAEAVGLQRVRDLRRVAVELVADRQDDHLRRRQP